MKSFRTEIENPVVEKDIVALERRIRLFKEKKISEEQFRSLRLARGVYGQRQPGVQMVRIKIPYGKLSAAQLRRIAAVSDEYSTGKLHITTRQDIQIHYVSLDRTPELWAELEKDAVTLREACGNTVRNVTASETAGIDPKEPFDVSPYAQAVFEYFLRNPICQEMGRKFKIAFSSSDSDTALSYMHDIGFIPKTKMLRNKEIRGFKVLLGGGLGSQPRHADTVYEFLETQKIIPFTEAVLRVFDRYGERSRRLKARMKFLLNDIGTEAFMKLVGEETESLPYREYPIIATTSEENNDITKKTTVPEVEIQDEKDFNLWLKTNVLPQKQRGFHAIGIRVYLGNIDTDTARRIAYLTEEYAAKEIRLTLRQNMLIPYVKEEFLAFFYTELRKIGLATPGYNSFTDITACPGTDTCNLGIASSTGIAAELESVLQNEYPEYVNNAAMTLKISGCMNACGQHMMAHIGFQGMSLRSGKLVAPALQVLLGGGVLGEGKGRFSERIVKIPSKRGPQALRLILDDYKVNAIDKEDFLAYYDRQGKRYFYDFLKPLSETNNLREDDFIDWGHHKSYIKAVGVGECAGVVIDLVATLFFESEEKIATATEALEQRQWADSIYHSYAAMVNTAKALLTATDQKTNTHAVVISQFDAFFVQTKRIVLKNSFQDMVCQIKKNRPSGKFAKTYLEAAKSFYHSADSYRANELTQKPSFSNRT